MTERRVDLGSFSEPLQAGNPLRIDVTARTNSGGTGLVPFDLTGATGIRYALFEMVGDVPVDTPSAVLELGDGITVTSQEGGTFAVQLTASHTATWRGRDWHACRVFDADGQPFDVFDGMIVSTVALRF